VKSDAPVDAESFGVPRKMKPTFMFQTKPSAKEEVSYIYIYIYICRYSLCSNLIMSVGFSFILLFLSLWFMAIN
jgi:hypothetical protein